MYVATNTSNSCLVISECETLNVCNATKTSKKKSDVISVGFIAFDQSRVTFSGRTFIWPSSYRSSSTFPLCCTTNRTIFQWFRIIAFDIEHKTEQNTQTPRKYAERAWNCYTPANLELRAIAMACLRDPLALQLTACVYAAPVAQRYAFPRSYAHG